GVKMRQHRLFKRHYLFFLLFFALFNYDELHNLRIRKVFCLRSICCFQRQGHGNFVGVMSRHGTAPPRVLPFSNKTEMACLYSILFKRPPQKNRDLTNGSWLNGAQVPFREYKSNKMVE